ncbi:MAG TPA: D-aminoacyl-tRNA deacylase [Candidatus Dormibacteraeota bacterium]|nr:D-aminoacyl-tRNA deacylase [Candidatus Dormibacteraeota bacterium]
MRAVVQRVASARVRVAGAVVGEIELGLLIYLGIAPSDSPEVGRRLALRLAQLRIFPDAHGRMNHSLLEVGGQALVVSQFTLFADSRRGHRPSFAGAAPAAEGSRLCQLFGDQLRELGISRVSEGIFGSHMVVEAVNDGPVTIVLTSSEVPWPADAG